MSRVRERGCAPSGTADPRNSHTDRWISRAAAATVAALAGIAGAISYSHMRQLAVDHGQAGWHAHAFPLSVDGIEIVASLVLLADQFPNHSLPQVREHLHSRPLRCLALLNS